MKILQYSILHLKRMLKNKLVFFFSIIFPIVTISVVVFLTSGKSGGESTLYLDLVNNDTGIMGKALVSTLKASPNVDVHISSLSEAENNIKNNTSAMAVIIPENFSGNFNNEGSPSVELLKLSNANVDASIQNKINSFISKELVINKTMNYAKAQDYSNHISLLTLKDDLSKGIDEGLAKTTVKTISNNNSLSLSGTLTINLTVSFLMYTMISVVSEILALKKNKTLRRSLSTPNTNFTIAASIILSFMFIGWIQVGLVIAITRFIFRISWGSSYISVFIVFTALLLVMLSMGLLMCRWIKNESSAAVIVNMVVSITGAVSGCFVPLNFMPNIIKTIAYFTPQNWALTGLTNLSLKNGGIISILPNTGILLLFALAFITAGASSLKRIIED